MKKGFTLIETLGVVIILGLIFAISYPSIVAKLQNTKEKTNEAYESLIIDASKDYYNKLFSKDELYSTHCIKVEDLIEEGILSASALKDSDIPLTQQISIANFNGYVEYALSTDCTNQYEGYFALNGDSNVVLSVGMPYTEEGVKAYSKTGQDLINNVTITYYDKDGNRILNIDTKEYAEFTVKYTLEIGNFTEELTRTVTITDNVAPVITFESNPVMIPITETEYSLYQGVTVYDDGEYTLTITGNISLGVEGTYQVTYTAIDQNNNKTTKVRTFIVSSSVIRDGYLLKNSINSKTEYYEYKAKIKNIYFQQSIPSLSYVKTYDVSKDHNGTITAYLVTNTINNTYYDLYIISDKKIYAPVNSYSLFNMKYVENIDFSNFYTTYVTDMSYMFYYAGYNASTFDIEDLSSWDTSNVTNMSYMFRDAGFNASTFDIGDLSSWDTSNVTNMSSMFSWAGYKATTFDIGDLSNWDTSKVTNMSSMFYSAGASATTFDIGDLSNWDTSKVTNMSYIFSQTGHNASTFDIGDLSNWDTSKVTNMSYMFYNAGYKASTFDIGDLSSWDTSKVTNMASMFQQAGYKATTFDIGDLSNWDTSNVTNMSSMFYSAGYKATTFDIGDLSEWDTSKVTDMSYMFYYFKNLNTTFYVNPEVLTSYSNMLSAAATSSSSSLVIKPSVCPSNVEGILNGILATKSSSSKVTLDYSSCGTRYMITDSTNNSNVIVPTGSYQNLSVKLSAKGYEIVSFKVDGNLVTGNSFIMPGHNVTISDVTLGELLYAESEHNPYANNINNVTYFEKTFSGATSITVDITYQTETTSYDWIYLYGTSYTSPKIGGSIKKTETITIPGNYVKLVFRTDGGGNNYYGFYATFTPNY